MEQPKEIKSYNFNNNFCKLKYFQSICKVRTYSGHPNKRAHPIKCAGQKLFEKLINAHDQINVQGGIFHKTLIKVHAEFYM